LPLIEDAADIPQLVIHLRISELTNKKPPKASLEKSGLACKEKGARECFEVTVSTSFRLLKPDGGAAEVLYALPRLGLPMLNKGL